MSQTVSPLQHPFQRCAATVAAAVAEASDASPVYLSTEAKGDVLVELSRDIARLEAMRLAVLATAGDVAERDAARNAGLWLAHAARLERPEGRRLQQLAEALDRRYPTLAAALLAGEVSRPQAEAIAGPLDQLPHDLDPDLRSKAEAHLVAKAGEFGPRDLKRLARRILEVVAPDVAEEEERRKLEGEERRARRKMRISRRNLGNGLVRVTADVPLLHADLLWTILHAFASPRRDHLDDRQGVDRRDPESGERLPYGTLLAQGFCSMLERLPQDAAPCQAGDAVSLVVTIDQDKLAADLGAAGLATGNRISVSEARRLACTAGILPMVLSGKSEPLDVGRKKRFHTPAMRKALAVRDRECRAAGCDIPAAWCEAHHGIPWTAANGPTNVDDGVLLCGFHHHRAHDRRYQTSRLPNGDYRFHRRT